MQYKSVHQKSATTARSAASLSAAADSAVVTAASCPFDAAAACSRLATGNYMELRSLLTAAGVENLQHTQQHSVGQSKRAGST